MKIIKRKMTVESEVSTAENNINEYLPHCQASFNSDGVITLRNYDKSNKEKDEIIILSRMETEAIVDLFVQFGCTITGRNLPF